MSYSIKPKFLGALGCLIVLAGLWVDSEYNEGSPVMDVRFNSDEYFRLATEKPGLVKYLSAGRRLIVVYQGVGYRIVE